MTLVPIVSADRIRAGTNTGQMPAGSVTRPKKTKKIAANRSRSGESSCTALWATGPERAIPTRKAPTAADTLTCSANPATSMVRPSTPRSSGSA